MPIRRLYIARHGDADAFGELTDVGRRQASLLGERLANVRIDAVWHSPLPRAAASARTLAQHLPSGTPVGEAAELIDHVPYVPTPAETPPSWRPMFDGYDAAEAAAGQGTAESLLARFGHLPDDAAGDSDTREVLITHAFQVAWLLRAAFGAPPARWLGLNSCNAALTVIEYRVGLPPTVVLFNDMSHLPAELRWTGFPRTIRP